MQLRDSWVHIVNILLKYVHLDTHKNITVMKNRVFIIAE